jgi:O-antigen/teichoic acid export membrane protein
MRKLLQHISVSKVFVLLNYFAIFIGLLNTYFRPKLFSSYFSESDFAVLTLIYGLAVYLAFLDGGISKPIYSSLREQFIKNSNYQRLVNQSYSFYTLVLIVALVFFSITVLSISSFIENTLTTALLLLLGVNLVLNFHVLNLKNILTAIDEYEFFQKIEVVRRASNLLAISFLFIDKTFILGNLVANIILIILIFKIKRTDRLLIPKINFKEGVVFYKKEFSKAKNFFVFTVNEILIYNSGFLLVPIFFDEIDIIKFGLLITVYNGIALFSRSIIDISVHSITKNFLENKKNKSFKIFKYSILLSSIISLLFFAGFYLFLNEIFNIWVGEKYMFSNLMLVGLLVFLIGNAVQHISGTLLLSLKNNFKLMRKISSVIFLAIAICQIVICYYNLELQYFFIITAIIYFLGSFLYLKKVLYLYKDK